MYNVAEKFVSINGEGKRCGQLAIFIRFSGCNLRCSYCDTEWACEKEAFNEQLSKEELYEYIKETKVNNVTITGGEPLWQENIKELLEFLSKDDDLHIEIETNGSIPLDEYTNLNREKISFTMDYKLPCSGMEDKMHIENLNKLEKTDVIKFVVGLERDLDRVLVLINEYDLINKTNVYLSPVFGSIDANEMVEFMKENNLNGVNMQIQMHKVIWSPDERGV